MQLGEIMRLCRPIRKKKHDNQTLTKKARKKKVCHYYGKLGHMEKACWEKTKDHEDKLKKIEGDVLSGLLTNLHH